jgi:hypothetical protein
MRNRPNISDGPDAVLSNHNVFRDGSFWRCRYCPQTWPFPSPIPRDAGPCRPRRWGGDHEQPKDPIVRRCATCGAEPGELCFDQRRAARFRMNKRHRGR